MSDFWKAFEAGADATVETMGEDILIAGLPMRGVVQPVEVRVSVVTGGTNVQVTHSIQMTLSDGAAVADGDKVESRMLHGRVASKEHFGGGWLVLAGPVNRWKEDDFR